jgi:mannose-6-phosphate isomerase-like protein (cupin superfamily)
VARARARVPQFFTLSALLEQARLAERHAVAFHESATWAAGVLHLGQAQHDAQGRHAQDELYLVLRGEGVLRIGDDRHPVAPGDFWFVPAGVEHRFEELQHELVVFYLLISA